MSTRKVAVPVGVEGAPVDVDEFLESAALSNLPFCCTRCESSIATLVAVTQQREDEVA